MDGYRGLLERDGELRDLVVPLRRRLRLEVSARNGLRALRDARERTEEPPRVDRDGDADEQRERAERREREDRALLAERRGLREIRHRGLDVIGERDDLLARAVLHRADLDELGVHGVAIILVVRGKEPIERDVVGRVRRLHRVELARQAEDDLSRRIVGRELAEVLQALARLFGLHRAHARQRVEEDRLRGERGSLVGHGVDDPRDGDLDGAELPERARHRDPALREHEALLRRSALRDGREAEGHRERDERDRERREDARRDHAARRRRGQRRSRVHSPSARATTLTRSTVFAPSLRNDRRLDAQAVTTVPPPLRA